MNWEGRGDVVKRLETTTCSDEHCTVCTWADDAAREILGLRQALREWYYEDVLDREWWGARNRLIEIAEQIVEEAER